MGLECLRAAPGTDLCNSRLITECGLAAVKTACVDGAYRDACAAIAADCADVLPEITGPVCESMLAAWKPETRRELLDCLRTACDTGGFGVCLP